MHDDALRMQINQQKLNNCYAVNSLSNISFKISNNSASGTGASSWDECHGTLGLYKYIHTSGANGSTY